MHRTYLADIERGARNVTLKSIAGLARALQVSVASLLVAPGSAASPGEPIPGPGEILLIDDDATDAEVTIKAFKEVKIINPFKVVRDVRQALDYLLCEGKFAARRPVPPELILLDLHLPEGGSLELLREIKRRKVLRPLPVMALAGPRDEALLEECARLGVDNHLTKPVRFGGLGQQTQKLNLHWTLTRPASGSREKQR